VSLGVVVISVVFVCRGGCVFLFFGFGWFWVICVCFFCLDDSMVLVCLNVSVCECFVGGYCLF